MHVFGSELLHVLGFVCTVPGSALGVGKGLAVVWAAL